jgi:2-polyprenyl-3-methyl-5-hydroxy-6-metoxy-1,4-benzoquinol methylase
VLAKTRLPSIAEHISVLKLECINERWPQFDAVCLWDVIEHVRDPVFVCRSLLNLLKPGGYLFLSTPDMNSLTAKLMKQRWAFMIPPLHLGYFSQGTFSYLFTEILPARVLTYQTHGKWTSLAFLFYKLNQISMWLAPQALLDWLSRTRLGHLNLYVPTDDILYMAVEKPM